MIRLSEIDTRAPESFDKAETIKERIKLAQEIAEYQHNLYANRNQALLVVLQGMDASGKDGVTRKIFANCSPVGVRANAFKKPTEKEFAHDFLWRIHKLAPQKGMIQIFNRSHYEDVLIQRVHKWIDEKTVDQRFAAINAFENLLQNDNSTIVLKFYLHISQERQKEKLQERIDNPKKNWKHNPGDWEEAKLWDQYRHAYEDVINRSEIPWHIVPADQKWYRDYFVAKKVCDQLKSLQEPYPTLESES